MKFQWSIQPRHTQLALDHVIHLNYRSMHIWPPTRLDNISWSFTFDSIIRSFWHNYISFWEFLLIFLLDGIAFGLLKNFTLYFWSLFLFSSRILVCATGFCSSIFVDSNTKRFLSVLGVLGKYFVSTKTKKFQKQCYPVLATQSRVIQVAYYSRELAGWFWWLVREWKV